MDTTEAKGLILTLFYNPRYRQCAAGGISETVEQVTVVGIADETTGASAGSNATMRPLPQGARVFAPDDDRPAVLLVKRNIAREVWHVVPADAYNDDGSKAHWYSAGGSYVGTSDSRISQLIGFYGALNLHDRKEW